MIDYDRIDTMVRAVVFSKPKKIAICPFAEAGMMAKQILNQRYGIDETYIIDNRLAEVNDKILPIEGLREENCDALIVLLMIQNKEINQVLEAQIKQVNSRIEIQNCLKPAWMKVPEKRDYFRQLKECLKVELPPEPQNRKLSLETLMAMDHDLQNDQLLLKMDVEGAEWDFLAEVSEPVLSRFRQITFELHRLTDVSQSKQILYGLEKLNKTHQLVWIHANNFGHVEKAEEGLEIPAYVEATYLNRKVYHTRKGSCCFPLAIDMPDCPSIEEYVLGEWGES